MKRVLLAVFVILFSLSTFRVVLSINNQPDYFIPDSNTEIPYDEDGNKLSFYDYVHFRINNNKEYITFYSLFEILSEFERYEFRAYKYIQEMATNARFLLNFVNSLDTEDWLPKSDNTLLDTLLSLLGTLVTSLESTINLIFSIFMIFSLSIKTAFPAMLDILELVQVVFYVVFELLGIAVGNL